MSELLAPQQQLASAINQLAQASQGGQLSYQSLETIVRQITSHHVVIAQGRVEISLPRQQLTGELRTGQSYQTQLSPQTDTGSQGTRETVGQAILRFFSPTDLRLDVPLTQAQSQSLILNLPSTAIKQIATAAQIITGRVIDVGPNTLTIDISRNGFNTSNTSTTPNQNRLVLIVPNALQNYTPNQNIQIRLNPENNNLSIILNATRQSSSRIPLFESTSQIQNERTLQVQVNSTTSLLNQFFPKSLDVSLANFVPALKKAVLTSNTTPINPKSSSANVSDASPSQAKPNSRISFTPNGLTISTKVNTEQAVIGNISATQAKQFNVQTVAANSPLNRAVEKNATRDLTTPQFGFSSAKTSNEDSAPRTITDELPSERLINQLRSSGRNIEILDQLQTLIRQSRPLSEPPSKTLESISQAISEANVVEDPLLSKIVKELKPLLNQAALGNGQENSDIIRQLLTLPPNVITPSSLSTAAPTNNLITGLIGLLQITLAARIAKTNIRSNEKTAQALTPILATQAITKPTKQQITKSLNELSQTDQKFTLLRELTKFFVSHQNNKLSSIEQQLNGQEGIYYILPSGIGDQTKDSELLIRRKHDDNDSTERKNHGTKCWHISMKLDVGSQGELLAKAKLKEQEVEVDFYVSNNNLKNTVLNFTPLLEKRLEQLGIQITKSQCQLGKIPESLQRKPYQILETRA